MLLIGKPNSLMETYADLMKELAVTKPGEVAVLTTQIRRFEKESEAWVDQITHFLAMNDSIKVGIIADNANARSEAERVRQNTEAEVGPLMSEYDSQVRDLRRAKLANALKEGRLEALRAAEPLSPEATIGTHDVPMPTEIPRLLKHSSNLLGVFCGTMFGLSMGAKLGNVDLSAVDRTGTVCLAIGAMFGIVSVLAIKGLVQETFGNVSWSRKLKKPCMGTVVLGSLGAIGLCAIDATVFRSGIFAANFFDAWSSGKKDSAGEAIQWVMSIAVTGPTMALAIGQGLLYSWGPLAEKQIATWQALELSSRIPAKSIQALEEEVMAGKKAIAVAEQALELDKTKINLESAYGDDLQKECLAEVRPVIEGLTVEQISILYGSFPRLVALNLKVELLANAMSKTLIARNSWYALALEPAPRAGFLNKILAKIWNKDGR